ncbi:MAG: hypothetical protein AB9866_13150 [Syntrophobacteraceae bacterium]
MKILIMAALPQEYSPLKKLTPSWVLLGKKPFKRYGFELNGLEIVLLESGMGAGSAKRALEYELDLFRPDIILFAGFAGGLHPDLFAGTVCVVERTRAIHSEILFRFEFPKRLCEFIVLHDLRSAYALTAFQPENKLALSSVTAGDLAVLDMETAVVAEFCLAGHIPFICFRTVSDAIEDELGFELSEITDEKGNVSLACVLRTVFRRPSAFRAFYLSWKRSTCASKRMCRVLAAFLRLPVKSLEEIAKEVRLVAENRQTGIRR